MRPQLSSFYSALENATHAGLAIDRLLAPKQDEQVDILKGNLEKIINIQASSAYASAFGRWENATESYLSLNATTLGPLAIGLGNASAYEVGLTLHHTYGVPYLPGSALKGLAKRAAQHTNLSPEAINIIFGDENSKDENSNSAVYVIFFDGWMKVNQQNPLQLDTITVHHQKYYGNAGADGFPTDFDDPIPVSFLSVKPDIKFELRLGGDREWAYIAAKLLKFGLENLGLGGKTNAGYGGFLVSDVLTPEEKAQAKQDKKAEQDAEDLKRWQKRIAGINGRNLNGEGMKLIDEMAVKLPATRPVLEALVMQVRKFEKKHATLTKIKGLLEQS